MKPWNSILVNEGEVPVSRNFIEKVSSEVIINSTTMKEIISTIRPKNVETNIINTGLTFE